MKIEVFASCITAFAAAITAIITCINMYKSGQERKNSPTMIKRNIAKKYVNKYLRHAELVYEGNKNPKMQHIPEFDEDKVNFDSIRTFIDKVNDTYFFWDNGKANNGRMDWIIQQIDLGEYDSYLFWANESYQNFKYQNQLFSNIMNSNISNIAVNNQQEEVQDKVVNNNQQEKIENKEDENV